MGALKTFLPVLTVLLFTKNTYTQKANTVFAQSLLMTYWTLYL